MHVCMHRYPPDVSIPPTCPLTLTPIPQSPHANLKLQFSHALTCVHTHLLTPSDMCAHKYTSHMSITHSCAFRHTITHVHTCVHTCSHACSALQVEINPSTVARGTGWCPLSQPPAGGQCRVGGGTCWPLVSRTREEEPTPSNLGRKLAL